MSRDSQECSKIYGQVFFFKALGRESNCLKETFKSLFLSLLRKEIVQILPTVLAVILPLPVFGFLGDVLPIQHMLQAATAEMFCIPRSFTPHWAFSFTHFGKMFIIGSGTDGSKSYKRQRVGWTWLYVGLRVTDEVETNWCGCGAGKFADGKLYGSWKTAWWALGPSSELKEQHCPPGSSSLGRRWQGILRQNGWQRWDLWRNSRRRFKNYINGRWMWRTAWETWHGCALSTPSQAKYETQYVGAKRDFSQLSVSPSIF